MIDRLSELYGRLLAFLVGVACLLLFALMVVICADVLLRNVALLPGVRGFPAANEFAEYTLYLVTLLAAPWLLRQGQHIRVDILLRAIPAPVAWTLEWLMDLLALATCALIVWYGIGASVDSMRAGSQVIKSVIFPEWWTIAPLPVCFALVGIEVLFRIRRLLTGERSPRSDAVSAS